MRIGNKEFQTSGHTYVMGILNVTPDSFSDGGRWNHMDDALFHAQSMIDEGADILDIGGESTRPGYTRISDEEEIARVAPVIEAVKSRFDIPISVDTYKSGVAKAAIAAGADLVNDIWGLKADPKMAEVIAKAKVPSCLMHNRETAVYNQFLDDVVADLKETLTIAEKAGICKDTIILDPGVGFAKSYEQNLAITNHLEVLGELGCPVLLGTSRKSMIGLTLDLPSDQREEGTMVTTVWAVQKRCMFVRVHNVQANVRAIKMAEALLRS
jgi:dihydropteroate synthase